MTFNKNLELHTVVLADHGCVTLVNHQIPHDREGLENAFKLGHTLNNWSTGIFSFGTSLAAAHSYLVILNTQDNIWSWGSTDMPGILRIDDLLTYK